MSIGVNLDFILINLYTSPLWNNRVLSCLLFKEVYNAEKERNGYEEDPRRS